jgi:hypothetical protein
MAFAKATSKKSIKESDDEEENDGDKENKDSVKTKRRIYNKVNSITDDNERMILSKENKVASPTKKIPLTPTLSSTSHLQITENFGSNGERVESNIECIANDTATNLKYTSSEKFDTTISLTQESLTASSEFQRQLVFYCLNMTMLEPYMRCMNLMQLKLTKF